MLKLNATAGTYTANTTIPLTKVFNTNPKFSLNNNVVSIMEPGFVETLGGINVTATAVGSVSINLIADGNVVATTSTSLAQVGDTGTIPIYDLFRVIPTNVLNGYSNVSLQANSSITINNGIITFKYIR